MEREIFQKMAVLVENIPIGNHCEVYGSVKETSHGLVGDNLIRCRFRSNMTCLLFEVRMSESIKDDSLI